MIHYSIQVILFQVLFLVAYDLFLSKETFFTKNRFYLLMTPVISFILPFIRIPTFQKAADNELIILLPEIILSPNKLIEESIFYESIHYGVILFWSGTILFFVIFLIKLIKIIRFIFIHETISGSTYKIVLIPNQTMAFSFFHYIFLGKEISETKKENIIQHELVHSTQKHSLDLLFFEFLRIIMWFNPMLYFYQRRISLVHEYISDHVVSKTTPKENYINNLLSSFFQVENILFINQFYKQSFIKKRIIMMTKNKSKKMNQLKYLLLIPVLVSMLFYSACTPASGIEGDTEVKNLRVEVEKLKDSIRSFERSNEMKDELILRLKNETLNEKEKIGAYKNYVPFSIIEKAPTFPGCESGDKKCFSKMIQKHFAKNFNSKLPNQLGLKPGKKRIFIGFKVDKEGNVTGIEVKAPHPDIKEEITRIISSLPVLEPGEQRGKKVGVRYAIPFTILVE